MESVAAGSATSHQLPPQVGKLGGAREDIPPVPMLEVALLQASHPTGDTTARRTRLPKAGGVIRDVQLRGDVTYECTRYPPTRRGAPSVARR